jgi:hypothetical protein
MTTFILTDANGTKHTVNEQQLKTLAAQGRITPETSLTTDDGHTGLAGQIPGLNFNTAVPPPAQPARQTYSPPRQSATYSQTNASGSPWLFDFAFQDIRLHQNARRICSFIYRCCVITLAINGLIGFFLLNPMYSPDTMAVALMFLVFYLFSAFIFLVLVRVVCEFLIVLLDYMSRNRER